MLATRPILARHSARCEMLANVRTASTPSTLRSSQSRALVYMQRRSLISSAGVTDSAQQAASIANESNTAGSSYFSDTDQRPVILYDGVCKLCNGAVDFMLKWDNDAKYRLAALQSDAGKRLLQRSGRAPDDISSIVLVERDKSYIKSDAVLHIASRLSLPLPLLSWLGLPLPHFIRDPAYDLVANNRYNLLGKRSCRVMEERYRERFLVD